MHKYIKPEFEELTKKVRFRLIGDFFLPSKALMPQGIKWRNLSILGLFTCIIFGASFAWGAKQEWICSVFT